MIREEYEQKLRSNDKTEQVSNFKMSKREFKQRQKLGDRGYCGKEMEKCKELKKATDFSTIFTLIVSILCFALYYWFYNLDKENVNKTVYIIVIVAFVLISLWSLVWFLCLRFLLNKKTRRLKAEIDSYYYKDKEEQMKKYERIKRLREQKLNGEKKNN